MNTFAHTAAHTARSGAGFFRRHTLRERLAEMLGRLRGAIARRAEWRTRRVVFRDMARLDDRMLDDIGLRRSDIESAASLPLEVNASLAVRQIAAERRASERRLRRR